MSRKTILLLLAFFVLMAAGSFYVVNIKNGRKAVDLTVGTTEKKRGAISKEDASNYVLLGRFTAPLKLNESGYLEGAYILEGDPNQTKLRILLTPDEGRLSVVKYQGDFSGTVSVGRLTPEEVMEKVKEDTPALIYISYTTTRPLKPFELYTQSNFDSLASGSWVIDRPESMIIVSSTIGLID